MNRKVGIGICSHHAGSSMSEERADWVGKTIGDGRFHVNAKLGEGGMGFVYRASDRVLETEVVIKVPRRAMLDDPEFKARFARENRALVKLQHPHIVSILFVGEEAGLPYAVMQYLAGGDLKDHQLAAGRGVIVPLPPHDLRRWLPGIAKALDFIHEEGFIHRDVKPANILFDGRGNTYLSDFGVTKVISEKPQNEGASLTGTGMVLGTPEYMAPELIMGEHIDGRVDQYALAVSVYELLCGRTPFEGSNPTSILVKQTTEPIPPLMHVNRAVPAAVAEAVTYGLAKNPQYRYPTCEAFAESVLAAVAGHPLHEPAMVPQSPRNVPPHPPLSSVELIEPILVEPLSFETASMSRPGTLAQSVPPLGANVVPPLVERPGSPPLKKRSRNTALLAVWLGLAFLFLLFLVALALTEPDALAGLFDGQASQPGSSARNALALSDEEKLLAVPLAQPRSDRDYVNSLGMKMLCISPGRYVGFRQGVTDWQKWNKHVEPYWIADREVSVAQYFEFVRSQPGQEAAYQPVWLKADSPHFVDSETSIYRPLAPPLYRNGSPITGLTYAQMLAFCRWLSGRPGEAMEYHLPARGHWVCAYRAGTETAYYWGEEFQTGQCNSQGASDGEALLAPTGSFSPNPWGLFNVAGNVAEVLAGGSEAAGGGWNDAAHQSHGALAVVPFSGESATFGFRVIATPKTSADRD